MQGERLATVIGLAGRMHPNRDILLNYRSPGEVQLHSNQLQTAKQLDQIGRIIPLKKKTKDLGILTLYNNGQGAYWMKPTRNIPQGIVESLASLDALADDLSPVNHRVIIESINKRYRWLTSLLEET
jgi:hypothetical protein